MKCLLIGGGGFMGEAITRGLQTAGVGHVRVFDLPEREPVIEAIDGVEFVAGNYLELSHHDELFADIDTVLYLSTDSHPQASMEDPERDARNNILPALRMMESCRHHGVESILFASSGGTIYGDNEGLPLTEEHAKEPLSAYGIVKLAIEHYLQLFHHHYGISTYSLRISNAYGPGQLKGTVIGSVANFLRKVIAGETIEVWGDGEIVRDYIYIDDIVEAFRRIILGDDSVPAGNYNVGSGIGHSLNDVIRLVSQATGRTPDVHYAPARGFDVEHIVLDTRKLAQATGWAPSHSLEEGIALMVKMCSK